MDLTVLEKKIFTHPLYADLSIDAKRNERQKVLDNITDEVLHDLDPLGITLHTESVYDDTAQAYRNEPHNQGIIDSLIDFMDMLPTKGWVLELGFGTGRDALFMNFGNSDFRRSQMTRKSEGKTTLEKYPIPPDSQNFTVLALDKSFEMLKLADDWHRNLRKQYPDPNRPQLVFQMSDIHGLNHSVTNVFDGIWSCTALLTHTPKPYLIPSIAQCYDRLRPGGILFLSYTNGSVDGRYDNLLLSSTGRIKYFSMPKPDSVADIAEHLGFKLEKQAFSHLERDDKIVKPNLFVEQFFRKA